MKVIERKTRPREPLPVDGQTRSLLGVVRRANSQQRFFNAALLIGMVCISVASLLLFNRSNAQDDAIVSLVGSLRDTCQQADNATLSAGTRDDCARIEQGQAPLVVEGIPGRVGATGEAGAAGPSGAPGAPGESPPCLATPEMCEGRDGLNGTNGVDGQSPPCLATPAMCQGSDGANGTDGQNGEPPLGWSTARTDGSVETCEREANFDPATPRYACTTTPPPDNEGGLFG